MAPSYKLTYFDLPSAAEPIRFIFNYAGIEFEDARVQGQDWPAVKAATPFGQVPILEHNGKVVNQSTAICRYVAKLGKLTGKDEWEDLEIDAIVATIDDLRQKFNGLWMVPEDQKQQKIDEVLTFAQSYLPKFEELVKKNNGFFVGGKITWADLYWVSLLDIFNFRAEKDILENYPNLQTQRDRVLSNANIKKYLAQRPKFP